MKKQNYDIVDFHSHILPRVDHGSTSIDMSLSQLKYAADVGVSRIIATPHFYPNVHYVDSFLQKRTAAYEKLESSLTPDLPKVRLGAEILICENLHNLDGLDSLCVQGTKTLLLELPRENHGFDFTYTVLELISRGYSIVLAHADRYNPKDVEKLIEVGAKIQLNADALTSLCIKCVYKNWMERKTVVALGSDIHLDDKKAYKNFAKAKSKLGEYAEYLAKYSDNFWI